MKRPVKILGALSVAFFLATPMLGDIGAGPCSTAWKVPDILNGEAWHSFGEVPPGHSQDADTTRENSHWSATMGYLTLAQHPACEHAQEGCGEDDEQEGCDGLPD